MKKFFKALSILLAIVTVFGCSLTGCSGGGSTKTVLYVWNYDGGVGHAWLDAAIERFETLHAESEYTEGKIGVKIEPTNTKNEGDLDGIYSSKNVVWFAQGIKFNDRRNQFLAINDVVTTAIDGEGTATIEGKMDENTANALKAADGNYYVLPHYQSYDGVVYNRTMFEEKGFFFVENPAADGMPVSSTEIAYGFVNILDSTKKNDKSLRTVGPDGIRCTHADDVKCACDDGLPSSIVEFKRLLNYMQMCEVVPFIWMDGSNKAYQLKLTNALWANLEGYEGTMANFTFDSGANTTRIVTGWDGDTPVVDPTTGVISITKENAYKLYQQESKYYALDLSATIFDRNRSIPYYHDTYSKDGAEYSNTYIQKKFLEGEAAMMLEGSYWENEIKSVGTYPSSAADLDIRMMPLPIQATGSVTEGNGRAAVQIDTLESYAFISKNAADRGGDGITRLAKDFLKFLYTDQSLAEFTEKSSVVKNLEYTISDTQYSSLSSFAQSIYDTKINGDIVVPVSSSPIYYKNQKTFSMYSDTTIWQTTISGIAEESPYSGLRQVSAKEYFTNMAKQASWLSSFAGYND